jgi:pimeloyl-ACP methyl ester carboxylesterase
MGTPLVDDWAELGRHLEVDGEGVFVVDQLAEEPDGSPPLLVLHGFPTSSIDYSAVLPALHARRRVVLVDFPGFGWSDKPDRRYSIEHHADVVEEVAGRLGLGEVDLLTHDMGDSIGGELLARGLEGNLAFGVRRRVLANGSIYLDLAQLTAGQQQLLALPDERTAAAEAPPVELLEAALLATLAPAHTPESQPDAAHLNAAAELVARAGGNELLPRTIRYIEDRRRAEDRYTGAIESHPAALTVVWGVLDPIAVFPMAERLVERCGDATLVEMTGIGHYPMLEAPAAFADAVCAALL